MKKLCKSFPLALVFMLLFATAGFAQNKATLSGSIKNPKGKKVYLSTHTDNITFNQVMVDSAALDKKGNFTMTFTWNQAGEATFAHGDEIAHVYLTPGDNLHLTLNTAQFDETLKFSGKGSAINNFLAQKYLREEQLQMPRALAAKKTENDFVKFADSLRDADLAFVDNYFAKIKTANDADMVVANAQKAAVKYNWAASRLFYPNLHSYYNKLEEPYKPNESYYNFLEEMVSERENNNPTNAYLDFAESYADYLTAKARAEDEELKNEPYSKTYFDVVTHRFTGKTKAFLQTQALYNGLTMGGGADEVEPLMDSYQTQTAKWPEYVAIINKAYERALPLKSGNPAPDFTVTNLDGRKLKLSDYKGKVVFIDVWASWCGPCLGEIPHAKKLMDGLEDDDVVFLNVSVDQSEKAWRDAIKKHDVKGNNVLANGAFKSDIAQSYNINAIPHYILIGRDGHIIKANAGRPSTTALDEIRQALRQ